MLLSVLLYAGLLTLLVGALSVVVPLPWLGIRTRRAGAAVLASGLVVAIVVCAWPPPPARAGRASAGIDAVMPAWEFREVHSVRLRASRQRAFAAIRAVTPGEIRYLRTLMGIRSIPERLLGGGRRPALVPGYSIVSITRRDTMLEFDTRAGRRRSASGTGTVVEYALRRGADPAAPDTIIGRYVEAVRRRGGKRVAGRGCCSATLELGDPAWPTRVEVTASPDGRRFRLAYVEPPDWFSARTPILDLFRRSGFVVLAEAPDRELVLGSVQRYWQTVGGPPPKIGSAAEFEAFHAPDFAKVAFNLRAADEGDGWTRVTTETRVLATDGAAERKFAVYWRFIYPGSALIRRSMLDAIRRRAEQRER